MLVLPLDKQLHLFAGYGIAVSVGVLISSTLAGFVAAVVIGIAKEVYDRYAPGHTCDIADARMTALGGGLGALFLLGAS